MPSLKKIILTLIIQFLLFNSLNCDFSTELENFTDNAKELEIKDSTTDCSTFTNLETLQILVDVTPIASILADCDLYLKTNQVNKRPITTMPIFNLYHLEYGCSDWLFKFNFFGNVSKKQYFTEECPFLKSYIALQDPCIINKLEENPLTNNFITQIKNGLNLVKDIKIEERRAGLMTQFFKNYKKLSFECNIPFFYQERNFILTEEEIYDIKLSVPGGRTDVDSEQVEKEMMEHVISDRVGFGDTKIKLGYLVLDDTNLCAKFGFQTTLPTTLNLRTGLLGSNFRKNLCTPKINLRQIICIGMSFLTDPSALDKLRTIGMPIAFAALDRLSALVLDDPLGNHKHFTMGLFFEPRIKITEQISIFANLSYEYAFSHFEKRFFLKKTHLDIPKYEQDIKDDNEAAATKDVAQITEAAINALFPALYKTDIFPKNSLQFTIGTKYTLDEWNFNFGYDVWWQSKEKIGMICFQNTQDLKIKKGENVGSLQNKAFAGVGFNKIKRNYDWTLSLLGDYTFASDGIAKDFTIAARYEINF